MRGTSEPGFPDDSQIARMFALFRPQQGLTEVWMATSSSGSPNNGRGTDLAIFTGIWTDPAFLSGINMFQVMADRP